MPVLLKAIQKYRFMFDLDLIKKVYTELPGKVAAAGTC
jgi:hypothetical protein